MSEHSFDVQVAKLVGVNSAIIFKHFSFWIEKNMADKRMEKDGDYWMFTSIRAMEEIFPYFSTQNIRTAITKLIEKDLIKTGHFNANKVDRTLWYSFGNNGKCIREKQQMDLLISTNANVGSNKSINKIEENKIKEEDINITSSAYDPCTICTPASNAPLHNMHPIPAFDAHIKNSTEIGTVPKTALSNNKSVSIYSSDIDSYLPESSKPNKTVTTRHSFNASDYLLSLGCDEELVSDFLALRKAKKAPLSKTALNTISKEANKAGYTLSDALQTCCARGWAGFKAEWVARDTFNQSTSRVPESTDTLIQRSAEQAKRLEFLFNGANA